MTHTVPVVPAAFPTDRLEDTVLVQPATVSVPCHTGLLTTSVPLLTVVGPV